MKNVIYSLVLAMLVGMPTAIKAQRKPKSTVAASPMVSQYVDSLAAVRMAIANQMAQVKGQNSQPNANYYRLFAPLTFYHSPAKRALSLYGKSLAQNEELEAVDDALLAVYLNRPDLVKNNESRLSEVGTVNDEIETPLQHEVALVERVAPAPLQPDDEQIEVMVEKPNFWTYKGEYYLQFLQNYISGNWYKGGESNYSMLGSVLMEANYNNKQKVKWDNKLEMKLGFLTSKSDSLHSFKTSEDLLRLTSKLGLQASKKWYYTLQVLAYTQFYRGFKSNDPKTYSDFMSPFNLNVSLGMDYNVEWFNKKLTGTFHLAPVAYNFRYVDRLPLGPSYSLDAGKHSLHDLGSQFTVDLEWKISDNINWKSRMYGFTTYKRVEYEWENTFTFKFNKYISSQFFIYPRFDDGTFRDGHHGYWQFKEFMSLGFNYSF